MRAARSRRPNSSKQSMSAVMFCRILLIGLLGPMVGAQRPADAAVALGWAAESPAQRRLELRAWTRAYRARMAPVKRSWTELSVTIRRGPLEELAGSCRSFQSALARLASDPLPPAPVPALGLHLERGLRHLYQASLRCRQERLFDLAYRLYEARRAFLQVEAMLK